MDISLSIWLSAVLIIYYYFLRLCNPARTMASSSHEGSWSRTTRRHSWLDCSERVISSSQGPLPGNTQHTQQTNIHDSGGNRTHDRSRRSAVNLRLIPRGHWDRRLLYLLTKIYYSQEDIASYSSNPSLQLGLLTMNTNTQWWSRTECEI
jgi:hypothetical protein